MHWAAMQFLSLVLILALAAKLGQSSELGFFHSLDQGTTWKPAGIVEGSLKDGEVTVMRQAMSAEEQQQLARLAGQDQFYLVRVGPHVFTSVRASCWATPSATESLKLAITEGQITGVTYTVNSPSCEAPITPGTAVHAPPTQPIQTQVTGPVMGPALSFDRTLTQAAGNANPRGAGNQGLGAGQRAGGGAGGPVTNRPLGGEGTEGTGEESGEGARQQQPAQEQSWLQKNWMFVAGGVMVALNMLTAGARGPPGAAPGAAPAARR